MNNTESNPAVGCALERRVMQQEIEMANFIDPSWIKTSDYSANFLPANTIAIDQASEDGDCTVKGFYDPDTGEYHIQEVVHNDVIQGPRSGPAGMEG